MRSLIFLSVLLLAGCQANSGSPSPAAEPVAKPLGIGDPAPPFEVSQWLHGTPVTLKPGTAYVIDFWAIWCGPCIQAMPHLDGLAKEYAGQGFEFIAVTSPDNRGTTLDRVQKFVDETGKKYALHFAWCGTDAIHVAWMEAARQEGIPCSFVVDKNGKIAFIGHPADLDDILPRVTAGTWRGKEDLEAIAASSKKLEEIFDRVQRMGQGAVDRLESGSSEEAKRTAFHAASAKASLAALEELAAFEKEHPHKARQFVVMAQRMNLLIRVGRFDDARTLALELLARAKAARDVNQADYIRQCWISKWYNFERKYLNLAVTAADQLLEIQGESDLAANLAAAEAYKAVGNKERHDFYAAKARALTATDAERRQKVEEALKSFQ